MKEREQEPVIGFIRANYADNGQDYTIDAVMIEYGVTRDHAVNLLEYVLSIESARS